MAKNYINEGDVIPVVNGASAVVSGQIVAIGGANLVGIAATDCPANGTLQVIVEGHVDVPKLAATNYLQGAKVLCDPPNNLAGQGTTVLGYCTISTPANATTVRVKLDPHAA